ncbi:hypothetical protein SAMN04488510_1481 [Fervidobacterium changbaicum]|nr:hypothetical protein [Fervidobacterium sp.]SDH04101.1 hypothetical protein SAMN04488510_103128 [Fervidobacterium changbaicum]SDH05645.1 hypothetical protein SAMN04488510_1041 [Fervidobacterium changbaicum]SDH32934.1 hypothetical protein SAMN04488510_11054 [Fervidobacterium changbaicum]SDH44656.1 hypothetical protein SAMN04488510_1151 [Fervidobacterium changbaicum]SDH63581.1 hypothetical protein SAMN04488510_12241 [Fervidobacterium changbaicum]
MNKSESALTVFAKVLLVTVLIMTVFVDVGRAAFGARDYRILHSGVPPFCEN